MNTYALTGVVICISYYLWQKRREKSTELFYKDNQFNLNVIKQCPSLHNYNPTFYLNGFLHTIISTIRKPHELHTSNRENIGDFGISVDWIDKGKGIDQNKPLLLIMPGLTGKVTDGYINTIVSEAHKQHFHNICIYNYRMLSNTANFQHEPEFQNYGLNFKPNEFAKDYVTKEFYGIDNDFYYFEEDIIKGKRSRIDLAADLHFTLQHLKNKYNFNQIVVLGCSYGGQQLGVYLGRFGEKALIDAGVAVGAPHSLIICQNFLTYIMNMSLTKILQKNLRQNIQVFEKQQSIIQQWGIKINEALNARWIEDFDQNYVIPLYGYRTTDSYYRHFSIVNHVQNINVPFLCISSKDDQVCPYQAVCKDELILNGKSILCMAKAGGHIGFLENWNMNQIWFPKPAMEFLKQFVKDI